MRWISISGRLPKRVLSSTFTVGETLDIVAQGLQLACNLAREVAAPAHLGLLTHDVLSRAQAQGWGQQGFPIAAKTLEAMAGCELRSKPIGDAPSYQTEDPRRAGDLAFPWWTGKYRDDRGCASSGTPIRTRR
jgi:hypothetical protein